MQLLPSGWLHTKTYVENRSQTLAPPPSTILKTLGDPPIQSLSSLAKGVQPSSISPASVAIDHELFP